MVDVSQLPRFPMNGTAPVSTGWPTKFDTGPASIDGPYTPTPVPVRAPVPVQAYAAANPYLANLAGGLPQAPSPMNDPAALMSQQLPPTPPRPNVVSALGAGVRTISQMGPPSRPVTPTPASAAPGGSKPAGSAPAPKSPVPAQQLLGIPQGHLSPREAQILLAGPAPMSPDLAAQYQILGFHNNMFHKNLAETEGKYQELLNNSKTDQDRVNAEGFRKTNTNKAIQGLLEGLSSVILSGNPQGALIRQQMQQQTQDSGMPDGSGIQ